MKKRKIIFWILAITVVFVAVIAFCDVTVSRNASDKTYDNVNSIPHRKVGVILGTSPISTWTGKRNYYFDHRIKAGAELYKAGKVDWLVVSGGDYRNTENGYDEPVAMRDSLIRQGVDSARIVLDYDGTRTLNSIAKMRDVYCQDSIIIISQKYHNERALYQAKHLGIDAIAEFTDPEKAAQAQLEMMNYATLMKQYPATKAAAQVRSRCDNYYDYTLQKR